MLNKIVIKSNLTVTIFILRTFIIPVLTTLTLYHQSIESAIQTGIVDALRKSLFTRAARLSVRALTVMILEMPETLVRHLPDLLWEMSKMSNTVLMAIPVLEFLSSKVLLQNFKKIISCE